MKNFIFIGLISLLITSFSCKKESSNPVNPPNDKPLVKLVKPAPNTILLDEVNVEIEASDDKEVTKVEFIACDKFVETFTSAPYKFVWITTQHIFTGDSTVHYIYAKAYDADSNCTITPITTLIYSKYCYGLYLKDGTNSNSFTLKWSSHGNTDQIIIQKANLLDPLNYVNIGTLPSNSLEYSVINPDTVASYQYRVKSFISGDVSYSNPISLNYSNGSWRQN